MTEMAEAPPAAETAEYHWIVTLQSTDGNRTTSGTATGTADLLPGTTDREAFNMVLPEAKRTAGFPDSAHPVVLFYRLVPNRLAT